MQCLAHNTTCHRACGHSSAAGAGSGLKLGFPRSSPMIAQLGPQRRDVRSQSAGSLVGSVVLAGVAAYVLSKQMDAAEQDQLQTTSRRPCPNCSGSGYEACHCTRWSDGDVGCSSCGRSGMMKCRSCGGGGTAVPIKVTVRKDL